MNNSLKVVFGLLIVILIISFISIMKPQTKPQPNVEVSESFFDLPEPIFKTVETHTILNDAAYVITHIEVRHRFKPLNEEIDKNVMRMVRNSASLFGYHQKDLFIVHLRKLLKNNHYEIDSLTMKLK